MHYYLMQRALDLKISQDSSICYMTLNRLVYASVSCKTELIKGLLDIVLFF